MPRGPTPPPHPPLTASSSSRSSCTSGSRLFGTPKEYLYGANPTYHDCHSTSIDHGNQTEGYYPCLKPDVFNPTDLNADDWMAASASLGMKEIIITADHEGGCEGPARRGLPSALPEPSLGSPFPPLSLHAPAMIRCPLPFWEVNRVLISRLPCASSSLPMAGQLLQLTLLRRGLEVEERQGPLHAWYTLLCSASSPTPQIAGASKSAASCCFYACPHPPCALGSVIGDRNANKGRTYDPAPSGCLRC